MSAELCEKCVHHKVCFKDKNLVGDVFVPGNPMLFDNKELWKKYEERKAKGFPCDDYLPIVPVPNHGRLIDADALNELFKDEERYGYIDALDVVCLPTIIEAEEGE